MKLTKEDRERLAERISSDAEYVVHLHAQGAIHDFEAYCESPIEALLGAAFHFAGNAVNFARARAALIYLNEPDRSRKPLLPAQWELVPQYKWENYRIDFAVFTELPYPVFVECDGHDFHERTKEQAARDREKDRRIQAAGIPILRFTGSQIHAGAITCGFEIYNLIRFRLEAMKQAAAS